MVLKNGTLRWSTPARLNDPFDMQFAFQLPANMAVVRAKALEKLYRHFWGGRSKQPFAEGVLGTIARGSLPPKPRDHFAEEIGPVLDKTIENFINARGHFNDLLVNQQCYNARILCPSEVCTSIVMWSYYAANHSGIVLGFSSHKAESPFRLAHPVKYVAQMPNLYDEETLSGMLAGYVELNPADFVGDVVWTKSLHWSHELEWRIYSDESNRIAPYEDIPFSPDDLRSVIFGVRISDEDRGALAELLTLKYPHVKLLQAFLKPDAYEIGIAPQPMPLPIT